MPTLHDGREVASDSLEWRDECLARMVLDLPGSRAEWLADFARRNGQAKADALADRVRTLRHARNVARAEQ
jgi:hypothetical protein